MTPIELEALSGQIKDRIDAYCVKTYTDEHRKHLGASVIGHDCSRYIWYAFRWYKKEIFNGRMLRLFDRGKREEARWVEWLRGIGMQVWEVDPRTNEQFRIWACGRHYGGSSDAVGQDTGMPAMLVEMKTHNYKSFQNLVNKKLQLAKPRHYAQMCSYGKFYNLQYGLYCASAKNDDDIYTQVVKLDWDLGDDLVRKAEDIILTRTPPNKISQTPTYFECKYCPMTQICHEGAPPERNCRSCRMSKPVDDAKWLCEQHQTIIPDHIMPVGCDWYGAV